MRINRAPNGRARVVKAVTPIGSAPNTNKLLPSYRIVVCFECKAEIGDPCTYPDGRVRSSVHLCRKRIAIRHARENGLLP